MWEVIWKIGCGEDIMVSEVRFVNFPVLLESGEDGWILAECPSLPGCMTQGRNEEEALENIKDAIRGWLTAEAEKQKTKDGNAKLVEVAL